MRTSPRAAAWILYLLTLVSALPLAAIVAAENPMPEGACSGIGGGSWVLVALAKVSGG